MSAPAPRRLLCRAVLLDLDGTLVDSAASVDRQWRRWAALHGLDPDVVAPAVHGRRGVEIIRHFAPQLDAERELRERLIPWEASDVEGNAAIPGAASLVAALPGDQWAVVTSGPPPVALARLRSVGLPVPHVLVSAEDVSRGKPDPEGYLLAARRLGATPEGCVVVEDAPVGVAAARAAGMRVVAVTTTHAAEALGEADVVVPDLRYVRAATADDGTIELTATPPTVDGRG